MKKKIKTKSAKCNRNLLKVKLENKSIQSSSENERIKNKNKNFGWRVLEEIKCDWISQK
jgi:hypothetical protein